MERETGGHEEDSGRNGIRAKGKSSPADRAARAGGSDRADEGGAARERVPFRLVANQERTRRAFRYGRQQYQPSVPGDVFTRNVMVEAIRGESVSLFPRWPQAW